MEVTLLGNIVNRYKVNDLARDFGMQTKQIVEILGKYFDKPKKSGQNLNDHELTVVFEYLTQHNQASSIESIYADVPASAPAPAPQEPEKARPSPRASRRRAADSSSNPVRRRAGSSSPPSPSSPTRPRGGGSSVPSSSNSSKRADNSRASSNSSSPPPVCRRPRWWIPARPLT